MEKDPRSQIKCIHLEVRHYDVLMYDDELYDHKLYAGCQNISLSNCFQNVLTNKCLGIIFRPNVTFMFYFFFLDDWFILHMIFLIRWNSAA